ncbi:MAG: hypothetical protein D6737_03505 [Chloroflexi bacterium]|nr:MAG: hypothetical protein CUN54_04140 [Phototrophicales bacterium]RMF81947.1 MAG: hypothetical protein D6737_03505 [Chloroflexota bacterium]
MLALLLAAIIVFLFPVAVWISSSFDLLKPGTFKDGLDDQNIYPDIVPVVLPAILAANNNPDNIVTRIRDSVGDEQWRAIAAELVPPEWVQAQVETGIDNYFAWLDGDSTAIDKMLDTQIVRQRLRGVQAERAVDLIMVSAKPCSVEEIARLRRIARGAGASDAIPVCHPPNDSDLTMLERQLLLDQLHHIADVIETQDVSLVGLFGGREARDTMLAQRLTFQSMPDFIALFYLVPLALTTLVVVLVVRSLKSFGRWTGWISIASGLIALIPLAILPLAIIGSFEGDSVVNGGKLDAETQLFLVRLTTGLLTSMFTAFSEPVLAQAFILVVLGLILLAIAAFAPNMPQYESIAAPQTPTGMNVTPPDEKTVIDDTASKRRRKFPLKLGALKSKSTAVGKQTYVAKSAAQEEQPPPDDAPTITQN